MALILQTTPRARAAASTTTAAAAQTAAGPAAAAGAAAAGYRSLGEHLREARVLSDAQVEEILLAQRRRGLRFGETALALRLLTPGQLQQALARQYAYALPATQDHGLAPALVMVHAPFSDAAERLRSLRSQLWPDAAVGGALAVVSAQRGDGRSVVAANLAIACSQLGLRTLLVDANLRCPGQRQLFALDAAAAAGGITGLLSGRPGAAPLPVAGLPDLFVLAAEQGVPNPLELLERPLFSLLLHDWSQQFDRIIVDTPAATGCADASVIAGKCGSALVLARPGRTPQPALAALLSALRLRACGLRGVMFNKG